jgi:small ligand-binding sensory domain FIST
VQAIAALSRHPVAAEATAEVVGQVLEQGPERRDLVVLFCSAHHVDAFAAVASTVHKLLDPGRLVGAAASGVIAGDREIEEGPAIGLWVADLGTVPPAVRLTAASTPTGTAIQGLPRLAPATTEGQEARAEATPEPTEATEATGPTEQPGPTGPTEATDGTGQARPTGPTDATEQTEASGLAVLLLADPFSLPVADVLDVLAAGGVPVPVVGGVASAALVPGGNRLALDDQVFVDGGVGVVLGTSDAGSTGPAVRVEAVVSQGCRPVGSPMIVTRAEGNQVVELAGRRALDRLEQVATSAAPDERTLLTQGVHLGIVADEHQEAFGRGDFLVRSIVGADRQRGALSVGAMVEVGTTVQFHVRDASSADDDLRALLAGRQAEGALVFTCNGRGRQLFGEPDHDAQLVAEVTSGGAVAGMFCAGEVGPVGDRSFLHGFTACVLLLGGPSSG